jgi:hemolysin activation/secretion protein
VLGATLTRLLERAGEFDQRITLAVDARDYLNNCSIEGLPAGACGASGESVSVQPLALEYSAQRGGDRPLAVSAGLSHNLALGGRYGSAANIEAVRPGAHQRYTLVRLGLQAGVPITGDWRVNLRLGTQLSADALVPGEQFGIAGASTVRGYAEREVSGDSGASGSAELLSPALPDLNLRFAAFTDIGQVRNRLGSFCDNRGSRCTLASAGLGVRYAAGQAQFKLDLAHALRDARTTAKGDTRLHLQASLALR